LARALETMYAGRLEEAYDRLAYHYGRAGDPEKAALYLSLVATRAARNYAHAESASAFRQAREHAEHLPESEREQRVFDMLLGEWKALFYLGCRREAVELVLEFEDRVNRLADPLQVARLYWTLGVNWGFLGDRERTQASLMRAVTAAREAGDDQSLGGCIMMAAAERLFAGRARECVELARQAAAHLERAADTELLANAHAIQGLAHLVLGEVGPAREALGRLRTIGATTGDPRIRCNAAGRLGFLEALVGDLGTAITWCRQTVELAPEPYERAQAIGWLGYAYLERGDRPQAVAMLEEADRAAAYFSRHMQVLFKAYLADAYHAISRFDAAEALTRQYRRSRAPRPLVTATALRTAGRIALARGATAEARVRVEEALRAFTEIEWRLEIARTHLDLAAAAHAGADPVLREAHTLFASLGVARAVARTAERAQALGVTLPPPPGDP
jgi:tetratricopeptide (TPR) repeat protein